MASWFTIEKGIKKASGVNFRYAKSLERPRTFGVYFEIMHNQLDQIDRHPEQHMPIENASVALRLIDCALSTAPRLIANEDFSAMQAALDGMRAALQAVAPDFSILGWSKRSGINRPRNP